MPVKSTCVRDSYIARRVFWRVKYTGQCAESSAHTHTHTYTHTQKATKKEKVAHLGGLG